MYVIVDKNVENQEAREELILMAEVVKTKEGGI